MNILEKIFVSAFTWRNDKIEKIYKKTRQEIFKDADTEIYLRELSPIFNLETIKNLVPKLFSMNITISKFNQSFSATIQKIGDVMK